MSEVLSFIILYLVVGFLEIGFDIVFKPTYIFGFIIAWQALQLLLLYLQRRIRKRKVYDINNMDEPNPLLIDEPAFSPEKEDSPPKSKDLAPHVTTNKISDNINPEESLRTDSEHLDLAKMEEKLRLERDRWLQKEHHNDIQPLNSEISHLDSHIEIVIQASRSIEEILEKKFGAYGKGLHSKLSSIEEKLSSHIVKKIRWVATVRNQTVHSNSASFDKNDYIQTYQDIISHLQNA